SGQRVFEATVPLHSTPVVKISGSLSKVRLWSPETPTLYTLEIALQGPVRYRRRSRFGFRSFETRDKKVYLNDKPFYMIAALDQDFYPETVHSPTSEGFVRDMMTKAKGLGINVLRCHLKVAHPVYLDV